MIHRFLQPQLSFITSSDFVSSPSSIVTDLTFLVLSFRPSALSYLPFLSIISNRHSFVFSQSLGLSLAHVARHCRLLSVGDRNGLWRDRTFIGPHKPTSLVLPPTLGRRRLPIVTSACSRLRLNRPQGHRPAPPSYQTCAILRPIRNWNSWRTIESTTSGAYTLKSRTSERRSSETQPCSWAGYHSTCSCQRSSRYQASCTSRTSSTQTPISTASRHPKPSAAW